MTSERPLGQRSGTSNGADRPRAAEAALPTIPENMSADLEDLIHAASQAWRLSRAFENVSRSGPRDDEPLAEARRLLEEFWEHRRASP